MKVVVLAATKGENSDTYWADLRAEQKVILLVVQMADSKVVGKAALMGCERVGQ